MKSPTFVKQHLFGLFWWEESNNRTFFVKLLRHHKLCTSFNILERLISENFLLRSRISHAYVTQRVSSHSDERTSSYALLRTACFDACCAVYCVAVLWTWMALRLVPRMHTFVTLLLLCLTTLKWVKLYNLYGIHMYVYGTRKQTCMHIHVSCIAVPQVWGLLRLSPAITVTYTRIHVSTFRMCHTLCDTLTCMKRQDKAKHLTA